MQQFHANKIKTQIFFMQLQFYYSTRPCTEKKSGRGRGESGLLTTGAVVVRP